MPILAFAQEKFSFKPTLRNEIFTNFSSNTIFLSDENVISNSETVILNQDTLKHKINYSLDSKRGKIRLVLKPNQNDTLKVSYRILPFAFEKAFYKRKKITLETADTTGSFVKVQRKSSVFDLLEVEESNLQKSGSIFRSFEVGSNKNLTLNSGLRLQVSGKITPNVDVVAVLSDENTPIQPEGNTQNLEEVDKIFIDIQGPNFGATVGDYEINLEGTEFANYSRIAKGGKIDGKIRREELYVAASTGKSNFTTYEFLGQDGNQGPYELIGKNGETLITIPAGSERVYLDGERLTRGETNDYVIDYNVGELTFTKNQLITSDSRIIVDFEYTAENFNRTILVGNAKSELLKDKLKLQTTFIRESDDKNSPISGEYSEEVKKSLSQIGDDLDKNFVLEVTEKLGTGSYIEKQTLVQIDTLNFTDSLFTYYEFVPEQDGDFDVSFYQPTDGIGFYEQDSTANGEIFYRFLFGEIGSWDIRRTTYAVPSGENLADVLVEVQPFKNLKINGEVAFSEFDQNLFSSKDDNDNIGTAYNLTSELKNIKLGNFGSFGVNGRFRLKQKKFVEIDRVGEVEFNRRYNIDSDLNEKEELKEGQVFYFPRKDTKVTFGIGETKLGENFESFRKEFALNTFRKKGVQVEFNIDKINSKNKNETSVSRTNWLREKSKISYSFSKVTAGFNFDFEEFETKNTSEDTTLNSGERFYQTGPEISYSGIFGSEGRTSLLFRKDFNVVADKFVEESEAITFRNIFDFSKFKSWDLSSDFTYRKKDVSTQFENDFNFDTKTFLADLSVNQRGFGNGITSDWHYTVSDEQTREVVEKFIPDENGNYVFRDSTFELITDFDFGDKQRYRRELKPIGNFIPIINISASTRIRVKFKNFLKDIGLKPNWFFRNFGTETRLRVSEETQSTQRLDIYFLNLKIYQNQEKTINGFMRWTQDLIFFEDTRAQNLRIRFDLEKSVNNQLSVDKLKRTKQSYSLIHRGKFNRKYVISTFLTRSFDKRIYTNSNRQNSNLTLNSAELGFSYFWNKNLTLGHEFSTAWNFNKDEIKEEAKVLGFKPNLQYSFKQKGRFTTDFTYTKVFLETTNISVPFALTRGLQRGNSFYWSLRFDYRISEHVTSSLNYTGKKHSKETVNHLGRAEIRAFF